MKRSTKMRKNIKMLQNIDLAQGLLEVSARKAAGMRLHASFTSMTTLRRRPIPYEVYLAIKELLAE